MTTIELITIDPAMLKYKPVRASYTLYTRVEETYGKITGMHVKPFYKQVKFKG